MCCTNVCGSGEASLADYLAFIAGDEDFELTVYGVRKTSAAIERDIRAKEHNLRSLVATREASCARIETALAAARDTALMQADAARNAPGGLRGITAQTALTAGRVALMQVGRLELELRHEYTRLESGRSALDAIKARAAVQDDRVFYDAIRDTLNEARVPHEQLAYIEAASNDTLRQFAALEGQNIQYNTILEAHSGALVQSNNAVVGHGRFAQYNLSDTESLLSALDSLRADSHHVSATLSVLDALPSTPGHTSTQATHRADFSKLAGST